MKVLFFMPTLWSTPVLMSAFLTKFKTEHKVKFLTTSRTLIHSARNLAIDEMIQGNYDYLIMSDDDNIPNYDNFIDVMVRDDKDVVSWVIRLRNRKEDLNICYIENTEWFENFIHYKNIDEIYKWENILLPEKRKPVVEVWNCWCGLVCLSKKVCEDMKLKYPRPFENKLTYYIQKNAWNYIEFSPAIFGEQDFKANEKWGLNIRYRELSEDYLFFERVRNLWYKLYADTRIKCSHIWTQEILEV